MAKKQQSKNQNSKALLSKWTKPEVKDRAYRLARLFPEKITYKPLMAYHSFIVVNVSEAAIENNLEVNLDVLHASKDENGVHHAAVAIVITSNDKLL